MDPKKAVKDLVLEAFQDEEVQEMFGNLKANCQKRDGVTDDKLRDLLLDLVVESYMLSSSRQNVGFEPDAAGISCQGLEGSSTNDKHTMTEEHLQLQGVHNTNDSNNTQQKLTAPNLPSACQEVPKENAEITNVHDTNDEREASSCNSYPHTTFTEGSLYKRVLSALRLAKKESVTPNDGNCSTGYNTYQHIPCDHHKTMSDQDDNMRRVWMRLSDSASHDTSQGDELPKAGVEIDANLTTPEKTSVDGSEGPVCEEEPSLPFKTSLTEAQDAMSNQHFIRESDGDSNLDEYESASDNDTELENSLSSENISLSRASSCSFLTASDYLDDVLADPEEEAVLTKTIRPQFLGKYYLQRLVNARQTAAEIKARKPEPRVKLDKPCRLDTNLTYAVRQSLKRSLPLIAGKNKLSALMVMADGMFDEMSLDRDLDDLAWPYDPLAELRKSGLAMVDYMDPGPAESAIINTDDTKDHSSQSGSVQCSATVQVVSDLNNGDPENNRDDDSVETFKLAESLNLTPIASSGQPANVSVSDAGAAGQLVPSSPKLETISSVSKESLQSAETLRLLFKPLKSIVDSLFDRDSSRVLINQMQSPPTYDISKIKLLPSGYENTRQTSFVPLSDEPYKFHVSVRDETDFNNTNAISDYSTNAARLSDFSVDPYKRKKLFESLDLVRGIRPQFLGKFYLERLANARKSADEILAKKPEPSRVKNGKPCGFDTNLTYAVHQRLTRSLPLIAGKNKLSALMVMADGMFDKTSLDRDLNHLAWPNDPLAKLGASGLARIDYARPCISDHLLRTVAPVDPKDETTPVEISSSSIGKNLLPENSESKDVDISDIVSCPAQLHQSKLGTPEEHWSPRTNLQPTSFDQAVARRTPFKYPQVTSPPRTDKVLSNDTCENHQNCLDSVEGSQISLSSSDFIKTDDFTAGMLPLETTPSMRKDDDHHSVDSALGEETSATIFDKDDFESEAITTCTQANMHQHDREKGLGVFFKSLSPPSIGENEDLSSTVVGTVSSNVQLFEQLAVDGRESSLRSSKLESSEFPNITTSCKSVKKRALAFENFDICRPPSSAKPTMHRTEDESLYTVNIKAQVAMFEKLLNANTSS